MRVLASPACASRTWICSPLRPAPVRSPGCASASRRCKGWRWRAAGAWSRSRRSTRSRGPQRTRPGPGRTPIGASPPGWTRSAGRCSAALYAPDGRDLLIAPQSCRPPPFWTAGAQATDATRPSSSATARYDMREIDEARAGRALVQLRRRWRASSGRLRRRIRPRRAPARRRPHYIRASDAELARARRNT